MKNLFSFSLCIFFFNITCFSQWEKCSDNDLGPIFTTAVSGNNIYAGSFSEGVFLSTDYGTTWTPKNTLFWKNIVNGDIRSLAALNNYVFAGSRMAGIFVSNDYGETWTEKEHDLFFQLVVPVIIIKETDIFAGTSDGVYLSTDYGESWIKKCNGLTNTVIFWLEISGDDIFAATGNGVFLTTDNGETWVKKSKGLPENKVYSLVKFGDNLIAGSYGGVFLSTDYGENWILKGNGLPYPYDICFANAGNTLVAGIWEGIYISNDNGVNWTQSNLNMTINGAKTFEIIGDYIIAGAEGNIFRAKLTDLGITDVGGNTDKITKDFSIYPIPAKENIIISTSENFCNFEFEILSLQGQSIRNDKIISVETEINLQFLPPGVYFIRVGRYTKMFIKI